jgi:hypothetical protein
MTYNSSKYFVATYFPRYFQTEAQTQPAALQEPTRTRSGRGFKSLSETFPVISDNYFSEEEELMLMLALLA